MAIQFECPACGQPIEVDADCGGGAVACPYCRKTVTAPTESTFFHAPEARVARPAMGGSVQAYAGGVAPVPYTPAPGRNLVAVWALVLSCAAVALMVIASILLAPYAAELQAAVEGGKPSMEAQRELLESYGGIPPTRLLAGSLFMCGAMALWVAGLVCGIIGVRCEPWRRLALMALITTAVAPILLCCGGLGA